MIDHEYEVYSALKGDVQAKHPDLSCSSIEQATPPSFPFLAFEQYDNPIAMERYNGFEQYVAPKFRITVFCDNNDKVLAKTILADADAFMASVGFIRTFGPQKVATDLENVCKMITLYDGNLMDSIGTVYRR